MDEYGSVSESFEESLEKHLRPVVDKQACMDCPATENYGMDVYDMSRDALEIVERVLQDWFRSMDDASREEVRRLFEEMREVSIADFIMAMRERGMASPFELLATFFKAPEECPEDEVVEIIEPQAEV
jgi:hypothetical protein